MQENKQKFWQESIKDENFLIDVDDSNVITDIQLMTNNNKKTTFKKGDKFILELGEERKMFDEFQIAGTDLYVKKNLLEKLPPYESEMQLYDNHNKLSSSVQPEPEELDFVQPHKKVGAQLEIGQPEIIQCKECKHGSPDGKYGCRVYHYRRYETHDMKPDDFCSRAERKTNE